MWLSTTLPSGQSHSFSVKHAPPWERAKAPPYVRYGAPPESVSAYGSRLTDSLAMLKENRIIHANVPYRQTKESFSSSASHHQVWIYSDNASRFSASKQVQLPPSTSLKPRQTKYSETTLQFVANLDEYLTHAKTGTPAAAGAPRRNPSQLGEVR